VAGERIFQMKPPEKKSTIDWNIPRKPAGP
jgi:hypothetical protein